MLTSYLVAVVIKGVLLVPSHYVYGSLNREIEGLYYVPVFFLMQGRDYIYELDFFRALYELGIITLIFFIIYLKIKNNKFDKEQRT